MHRFLEGDLVHVTGGQYNHCDGTHLCRCSPTSKFSVLYIDRNERRVSTRFLEVATPEVSPMGLFDMPHSGTHERDLAVDRLTEAMAILVTTVAKLTDKVEELSLVVEASTKQQ